MSRILGAKFRDFGQIYYFDSGPYVVEVGDHVIVETDQGRGLAKVAVVRQDVPEGISEESVKTIFRLANAKDFDITEENNDLSRQAFSFCRKCIDTRKLEMKLVDVEIFYDRSKMIFYFTAPGRVDFRELVKDLVREYRTRIELRQIGVRHETQMIGAVGNCGQVCCCRRFMRSFDPVTIKMAKEQNLFLNPTKISGICGRLLCCLNFEQKNYEDFQRKCPKIGKRHNTGLGMVRVIRSNFFRNSLTLITENNEEREVSVDDWGELQAGASSEAMEQPVSSSQDKRSARSHKKTGAPSQQNDEKHFESVKQKSQVNEDDEGPRASGQNDAEDEKGVAVGEKKGKTEERKSKKARGKSRAARSRRGNRRKGRGNKSPDNSASGKSESNGGTAVKSKSGQSKPQGRSGKAGRPAQGRSKKRSEQKNSGAPSGKPGATQRKAKPKADRPTESKTNQ
jgi:cell fate regulator YaaT (PSP1 superfamily)